MHTLNHCAANWDGGCGGAFPGAITAAQVRAAMRTAAAALRANALTLADLDLAVGDGDLGATAGKVAASLAAYADQTDETDLGRLLGFAGVAVHRAVPGTMGALIATALIRAGKAVRGKHVAWPDDLARMLAAADAGLQARGGARLGDKTLIDATHPAAEAFSAAVAGGATLPEASAIMVAAARAGRDRVTRLRNRVGRASWFGAHSAGKQDPGATLALLVLEALAADPR
jgi:dihydroxyacetone kinase